MAYIINTATCFPSHYYPQEVLANVLRKHFWALKEKPEISPDVVDQFLEIDPQTGLDRISRFFTNVKIEGRYFMLPLDSFFDPPGIEANVNATINATVSLVEETIIKLLKKSNLEPEDISQLTCVSLVPSVPGIDARLMNRIPFSPNLKRIQYSTTGCMGGAYGVARVAEYLQGHPNEAAIIVASEPSSSLWQGSLQRDLAAMIQKFPKDPTQYSEIIMTLVTAALFGDGAAAVLMVGDNHSLAQKGKPRVVDSSSILLQNTINLMGMDMVDVGTRNILRPEVSDFVKVGLRQAILPLLEKHNLSTEQIVRWLVHPGGPKIIEAIEEEFNLDQDVLHLSREILAEVGNISSPTVLCILDKTLAEKQPPAESYGLMIAMGPGFSQEVILLQW